MESGYHSGTQNSWNNHLLANPLPSQMSMTHTMNMCTIDADVPYLTGRHSRTGGAGPTHNCMAERYQQHTGAVHIACITKRYTVCTLHVVGTAQDGCLHVSAAGAAQTVHCCILYEPLRAGTPLVSFHHEEALLYLLQDALKVLLLLYVLHVHIQSHKSTHATMGPDVNKLFISRQSSYIHTTHIDQQFQSSLVRFVLCLVVEILLLAFLLSGGHFHKTETQNCRVS